MTVLRRWTLKRFLSDFCGQSLVCELILVLVSLWLLVNSFKETFKEKCPIDFFDYFIIIFLKIFWLFYYFFKMFWLFYYFFWRYFDYFFIFLFFLFNRSYNVNDQLDFILIVIKRDYNTNDQLKFILSIIRRDNDLNKR